MITPRQSVSFNSENTLILIFGTKMVHFRAMRVTVFSELRLTDSQVVIMPDVFAEREASSEMDGGKFRERPSELQSLSVWEGFPLDLCVHWPCGV